MESQPQIPNLRNNPANFHQCVDHRKPKVDLFCQSVKRGVFRTKK